MADSGLLFVYGECSPDVTEDEFNDWYDNEHGPSRLAVPGFTNAVRYKATDAKPHHGSPEPYKALLPKASERERALIPRLATLNRRVYEILNITTKPDVPASVFPTKFLLVVTFLVQPELDEDFNKWYDEEHVPELAKVTGFQRARRYKLVDSVELTRKPDPSTAKPVHNYLTLYDTDRDDYSQLPEFHATLVTPWAVKILGQAKEFDVRRYGLYKNIQRPQ
ncbi:hypothetical protein BDZ97DRAFT_1907249 [Flammula alnicola]|nr:hypothetical protein BDZ97DRAFT_1907249 [Flammula alnicola]